MLETTTATGKPWSVDSTRTTVCPWRPRAQVQLIGNLRAVLFIALPGEEQHFVIRVGCEEFFL